MWPTGIRLLREALSKLTSATDYDLVLLTNFLHHFDPPTNETLLRKVHAALG